MRNPPKPPAGSLSSVELEHLLHVLSETEQKVIRRLGEVLAAEGADVAQWRVLALLAAEPGQPMSEVARYTLLPAASATRVIDRMVLDQLVYRSADACDRRRVIIRLSRAGRARYRRLAARVADRRDAILTPDDAARLQRLSDLVSC